MHKKVILFLLLIGFSADSFGGDFGITPNLHLAYQELMPLKVQHAFYFLRKHYPTKTRI